MIKEEYIEKALEEVDILRVFSDLHPNIEIKQRGARYLCLCPYHDDHNPSLNIDPARNRVHCFACGKSLSLIGLVQEEQGLNFPDAVRYIYQNYIPSVPLNDIYDSHSHQSEDYRKRRETQMAYMKAAHEFFRKEYMKDEHASNFCRFYAESGSDHEGGRWKKETCDLLGLGYAPGGKYTFVNWCKEKEYDLSMMQKIGLVTLKEENHEGKVVKYYEDAFSNMLMIPYTDKWGNVIAFTGRNLSWKPGDKMKYKNNSSLKGENLLYDKSSTPWGLHLMSYVHKAKKAYLVEGASDAMSILDLQINNILASIGGEWTEGQLKALKRKDMPILCFIPDIDPPTENVNGAMMGNGEKFVIRSAFRAIKLGFSVNIKAIPPTEDGSKIDAGEYFKDMKAWRKVKEEDFIIWYAGKYFNKSVTYRENTDAVKTVCQMLLDLEDQELCNYFFRQLTTKYKPKDIWEDAMRLARRSRNIDIQEKTKQKSGLNLAEYKLIEKDGCLYSLTNNNDAGKRLTNFTPKPLYHVKGDRLSPRIVELDNHKEKPCVIAFAQEELSKMDRCVTRLGLNGNYSLFTNAEEFKLFRALIYDGLKDVHNVGVIGWNVCGDDGFVAWGNGVFADNTWQEANQFGIVEYCGEYYYLPSASAANNNTADSTIQNMRLYMHRHDDTVSLEEYFDKVEAVFHDNGVISLLFGIATMFRDVVFGHLGFFPLAFIFGPNMAGKTTLAKNAMHFFLNGNQMANLGSSSYAGLSRLMGMMSNVPVLINEYFDTIGLMKIDLVKGIFEGTGRLITSNDSESFTQFMANCSLIITGQDLPGYDPAMFSRSLLLEQYKAVFDAEATERLDALKEYHNRGLTTLTLGLITHRNKFKERWRTSWKTTSAKFNNDIELTNTPQRVKECWSILYAVVDCLKESGARIPINRNRLYNICKEYILRQCEVMKSNDEVAKFWGRADLAHSKGKLIDGVAYRIQRVEEPIKVSINRKYIELTPKNFPHRILMLAMQTAYDVIEPLIRKDDKVISASSFVNYLENSPEYIGKKAASTYFRVADEKGNLLMTEVPDPKTGKTVPLRKSVRPLIFDYDSLAKKYEINLTDD